MPKRLRDGNVRIGFTAVDPEDYENPGLDWLNTGIDLSCSTLSDYTLGPTGSDTNNEKAVCEPNNVNALGASNYDASLTFFRYLTNDTYASDPSLDLPWRTFTGKGLHGWLYDRVGPPSDQDWAEGDIIRVFEVITDDPQDQNGVTGGYLKFIQPFSVQGRVDLRATVVAGS